MLTRRQCALLAPWFILFVVGWLGIVVVSVAVLNFETCRRTSWFIAGYVCCGIFGVGALVSGGLLAAYGPDVTS